MGQRKITLQKKIVAFVIAIFTVIAIGVHRVYANHYTPWTIVYATSPRCEYVNVPNMGRRGYLVQYITYKRTVMNGRTGRTHLEYRSERRVMGQGGGAGCPIQ